MNPEQPPIENWVEPRHFIIPRVLPILRLVEPEPFYDFDEDNPTDFPDVA